MAISRRVLSAKTRTTRMLGRCSESKSRVLPGGSDSTHAGPPHHNEGVILSGWRATLTRSCEPCNLTANRKVIFAAARILS